MFSKEHNNYLKKIKKHKIFIISMQILIIVLFLLLWQYLTDKNLINIFITSSPKRIIKTIIELYKSNNLFKNIFITTYETFLSFSLGTIIGIIIASLLWWKKTVAEILDPYLTVLNSLPKIALGPIIIIWVGAKMSSIITMALLISVIVAIINIYQAFITTDTLKINMLKSFKANKKDIFFKLVLPSNLPEIMNVLKVNVSMSLIGVIMGEFLISKEGLGYLITYGSQVFNLDLVMTGIFILCIIAMIMYFIINLTTNILLNYKIK